MAEQGPDNPDATSDPQADTDDLVQQALAEAQSSLADMQQTIESPQPDPAEDAVPNDAQPGDVQEIELLGDVELDVSIELGRTEMLVEDVLRLGNGSVVELDKLAGDPVDVHVNGRLVARGEVLVLNDNFCIRISEIVANLEEEAQAVAQQQEQAAA